MTTSTQDTWVRASYRCSMCEQVAASAALTQASLHQAARAHMGAAAPDRPRLFADGAHGAPADRQAPAASHAGTLIIDDVTGSNLTQVERSQFAAAHAAITGNSIRDLYRLRMLWAACYCPDCDCVYCADHWQLLPVYDDDGWYHGVYGVCPHKHQRRLSD